MKYVVKQFENEWVVEVLDEAEGSDFDIAMFSGPKAKALALEYAAWKIDQENQPILSLSTH